jgi:hypothetical protein
LALSEVRHLASRWLSWRKLFGTFSFTYCATRLLQTFPGCPSLLLAMQA